MRAGVHARTALDALIGDGETGGHESRATPGKALAQDLVVAVHHVEVVVVELTPGAVHDEDHGLGILVDVIGRHGEHGVGRGLGGKFLVAQKAHVAAHAHHVAGLEVRHVLVVPYHGRIGALAAHGELAALDHLPEERLARHGAQVEALVVIGEEVRDARVHSPVAIERREAATPDLVELLVHVLDAQHGISPFSSESEIIWQYLRAIPRAWARIRSKPNSSVQSSDTLETLLASMK